ncbi:MAG: DNA alkylation repair protein [Anaerolineales bacterium]
MPAINPSQLKIQSTELSEKFPQADQYISALHDLLSLYADRVHRSGQSGSPPPAIDAYHVPPPVLRHIERSVRAKLRASPEEGWPIIDALWEEEWLETRLLATIFLGYIPSTLKKEILSRVRTWISSCEEDLLLESIICRGLSSLRADDKESYFSFIDELPSLAGSKAGKSVLFSLKPLVMDESFQNLPLIFQYLKPLLQAEDESYLSALAEVVRTLARRSERETLFFLQHQIPTAPKPKITRLVRGSLNAFSPSSQKALKQAIRET